MRDPNLLSEGGAQWPEARGFERLYYQRPNVQARLAKALLGLREVELRGGELECAQAIEVVLGRFAVRYPEFLAETFQEDSDAGGDIYRADPRLLSLMQSLSKD